MKPPKGHWQGNDWIGGVDDDDGSSNHLEDGAIPIHYPTLYRSRLSLSRQLRSSNSTSSTQTDRMDSDSDSDSYTAILTEHTDSIYCLKAVGQWLITGSRDRSVRIWRLEPHNEKGQAGGTELVHTVENAHEGSVLCLELELGQKGGKGKMVTGSSDMTAGVWEIDWGTDRFGKGMKVQKVGTLRGHDGGVLDVKLGKGHIITWSVASYCSVSSLAE